MALPIRKLKGITPELEATKRTAWTQQKSFLRQR